MNLWMKLEGLSVWLRVGENYQKQKGRKTQDTRVPLWNTAPLIDAPKLSSPTNGSCVVLRVYLGSI